MARVGETIGIIDKVLSVLERLGLWGAVGSTAVSGGVFWVWSSMMSLPAPVIALCGLFGAAGGLWLYNRLNDLRRSRLEAIEKPDYEAWDHVEYLTIAQAANLWAECDPSAVGTKKKALPYLRMLKEQALLENIDTNSPGNVTQESIVPREELIVLARSKKLRPKFLFPEER